MFLPAGPSFATNASLVPPPYALPVVVGKFVDDVVPVTYAVPSTHTAMALPTSLPLPPRYVEYTSGAPETSSFDTNPSSPPDAVVCTAANVVGKFVEAVRPVT